MATIVAPITALSISKLVAIDTACVTIRCAPVISAAIDNSVITTDAISPNCGDPDVSGVRLSAVFCLSASRKKLANRHSPIMRPPQLAKISASNITDTASVSIVSQKISCLSRGEFNPTGISKMPSLNTRKILVMFEPVTLASAISGLPVSPALTETSNSGAAVPPAIMTEAIRRGGSCTRVASDTLAGISQYPTISKITSPSPNPDRC